LNCAASARIRSLLCCLGVLGALAAAPCVAASSEGVAVQRSDPNGGSDQNARRRSKKSVASIDAPLRQEFEAFLRERDAPPDADAEKLFREFLDQHPEAEAAPPHGARTRGGSR
jgi:hypothetical protein